MLNICPIFKAAPRIRHSVAAKRSALASDATTDPPCELPNNRPAASVRVPYARPTPNEANPAALPTLEEGTARPSFIRDSISSVECPSSSLSSDFAAVVLIGAFDESDEDSDAEPLSGSTSFSEEIVVSACSRYGFGIVSALC